MIQEHLQLLLKIVSLFSVFLDSPSFWCKQTKTHVFFNIPSST